MKACIWVAAMALACYGSEASAGDELLGCSTVCGVPDIFAVHAHSCQNAAIFDEDTPGKCQYSNEIFGLCQASEDCNSIALWGMLDDGVHHLKCTGLCLDLVRLMGNTEAIVKYSQAACWIAILGIPAIIGLIWSTYQMPTCCRFGSNEDKVMDRDIEELEEDNDFPGGSWKGNPSKTSSSNVIVLRPIPCITLVFRTSIFVWSTLELAVLLILAMVLIRFQDSLPVVHALSNAGCVNSLAGGTEMNNLIRLSTDFDWISIFGWSPVAACALATAGAMIEACMQLFRSRSMEQGSAWVYFFIIISMIVGLICVIDFYLYTHGLKEGLDAIHSSISQENGSWCVTCLTANANATGMC